MEEDHSNDDIEIYFAEPDLEESDTEEESRHQSFSVLFSFMPKINLKPIELISEFKFRLIYFQLSMAKLAQLFRSMAKLAQVFQATGGWI